MGGSDRSKFGVQPIFLKTAKIFLAIRKSIVYNITRQRKRKALSQYGGVAQLVRAFGSHPRGRGFESLRLHHNE